MGVERVEPKHLSSQTENGTPLNPVWMMAKRKKYGCRTQKKYSDLIQSHILPQQPFADTGHGLVITHWGHSL